MGRRKQRESTHSIGTRKKQKRESTHSMGTRKKQKKGSTQWGLCNVDCCSAIYMHKNSHKEKGAL
jgi:hypothetical protein